VRLDVDGRFELTARPPGYKLIVDGKTTVYCRDVPAVLAYVGEYLVSSADGEVVKALMSVGEKLSYARRVIDSAENVALVVRALARADREGGSDRRSRVIAVALELSGCPNVNVLKNSNQAKEYSNLAKAIVEAWGERRNDDDEGRREEAPIRSPGAELDQDV
jgi:hypothetical protein